MPNIRTYQNKIDGLQTNDRAVTAAAEAGRTIGRAYNNIGDSIESVVNTGVKLYDTFQEHKAREEMSHGLASSAQVVANLTDEWNETAKGADPNDPTTAEKWREETLNPVLDDWANSFQTEKGKLWATEKVAQMRQHFFEKTAADQSLLAGAAAVKNLDDFTNSSSNAAEKDPSSVDMWLGMAEDMADVTVKSLPKLTPAQALKVREDLRLNARKQVLVGGFYGMARANPDEAIKRLDGGYGANDLTAAEREQLRNHAETEKRAKEADAKAGIAAAKADLKSKATSALAGLQLGLVDDRGEPRPDPQLNRKLIDLQRQFPGLLDPSDIRALQNANSSAIEHEINGTFVQTDNSTWQMLASKIGNGLTHTMVNQAAAQDKLSNKDRAFLNQAVENETSDPAKNHSLSQLNQNIELLKQTITKSNPLQGKLDPDGDKYYYLFHYQMFQQFNTMVAGGMSPDEAVQKLTDPKNPFGVYLQAPRYTKTMQQSIDDTQKFGVMGSRPTPAGPGRGVQTLPDGSKVSGMAVVLPDGRVGMRPFPKPPEPRKPGESAADYLARTKK